MPSGSRLTVAANSMAYAAQAMRSVIVDYARKRSALRRGGGIANVTLTTEILDGAASTDSDVERVDDALNELEATDPRLKQVVEMRFFGGLTEQEIAEALGEPRPHRSARPGACPHAPMVSLRQ